MLSEKEDEQKLLVLDVRSIPEELLYSWNVAAKAALPNLSEFKHFLPRILDLVAHFEWVSCDIERCFQSFEPYSDGDWLPEERQILEDFARVLFGLRLKSDYSLPLDDPVALLVMFDITKIDVGKLLTMWETSNSIFAAMYFADNLAFVGRTTGNSFARPELKAQFERWLKDDRLLVHFSGILEKTVLDDGFHSPDFNKEEISRAYETIQMFLPKEFALP